MLNCTVALRGPVISAETTWSMRLSTSATGRAVPLPRGFGRRPGCCGRSATAVSFIVIWPEAPTRAGAPSNVTVWASPVPPDTPVTLRTPPGSSVTFRYAESCALAGSL